MDYALKKTAAGSFESVIEAVEACVEAHGLVVVGVHDVHRTVARKGFRIRPVRIYEVRDAGSSGAVGDEGAALRIPALVPGRISVFEEDGDIVVAAVRPGIVDDLYPEAGLAQAAQELERRLVAVVEEAALA